MPDVDTAETESLRSETDLVLQQQAQEHVGPVAGKTQGSGAEPRGTAPRPPPPGHAGAAAARSPPPWSRQLLPAPGHSRHQRISEYVVHVQIDQVMLGSHSAQEQAGKQAGQCDVVAVDESIFEGAVLHGRQALLLGPYLCRIPTTGPELHELLAG